LIILIRILIDNKIRKQEKMPYHKNTKGVKGFKGKVPPIRPPKTPIMGTGTLPVAPPPTVYYNINTGQTEIRR
jgi:hypothetical protein